MSGSTQLYLLRHADAGDPARWEGPDAGRPLSAEGIAQAERLASHLAAIGTQIDAIVSSPKRRAIETAEPLAAALGLKVVIDERLAGPLSPERLDEVLAASGDPRRPVLVGHDPDFSELLTSLVGAVDLRMKKGALARLETGRPLGAGSARLRWLIPPEALGRR